MTHAWKVALLLAVILLAISISLGWTAPQTTGTSNVPAFSAKDRERIETYYARIRGTLAPGSLDRTPFAPEIEKSLVRGSIVPIQLRKQLERLPQELQSQLSSAIGGYTPYRLGHHVVLAGDDMKIGDVLKNIVPK